MHRHGRHWGHHRHGWHGAPWWEAMAENMEAMGRSFEDWGEFPFGGFGRGKRGRRRMFAGGELRLVLLKLIAEQPRHGYELMKAIEELTGGAYSPSPGTVYPTLSLLEDEGAIEESAGEGARKLFEATTSGQAELEEREDEVKALLDRLAAMGQREERHRSPEVWRAMMNLGSALRTRMRGGADSGAIEEIVDIIDEAAKRIERL